MSISLLTRDMASSVPSTSGRVALAEALGRAVPGITSLFARSFASLVGSGIPSPRPDVALQLSTPHGGHINRMINTAESIVELDYVLHKFRKLLRPSNIGAATMKLELLRRYEQSTPASHKVLRVASELHKYVNTYSDRLSLTQIANVVRGMSSVQYRLPPQLLVRLAAGVIAEGGAALRFAAGADVRDVFYGFAGQGFTNRRFWSQLCTAVLPRLGSFDVNTLPGLVMALERAGQLPPPPRGQSHQQHYWPQQAAAELSDADGTAAAAAPIESRNGGDSAAATAAARGDRLAVAAAVETASELSAQVAVARAALQLIAGSLDRIQPGRLADTACLLVTVAPRLDAVQVDKRLVSKFQSAAMPGLPSLNPNQLTNMLLGLLYLRHAAASTSDPPSSASAAPSTSSITPLGPLPQHVVAAFEPHLQAAAPTMQLLHVKRTVQALAPSAAAAVAVAATTADAEAPKAAAIAPKAAASSKAEAGAVAAGASKGSEAAALNRLLNTLARRAALLLPSASEITAGAPRVLNRGSLARVPRGGKDAGAVLAAAAPAGDPRVAVDTPLLGLLEGLVRVYTWAMGVSDSAIPAAVAVASSSSSEQAVLRAARRRQLPDVAVLFDRVAVVAAAGRARGLLTDGQSTSLGIRLQLLLDEAAVAPLLLLVGSGSVTSSSPLLSSTASSTPLSQPRK
ncbi:hypothetical protein VOLCADRAFT_120347 [Volvox carteri f. nagariensis]|uniref:Uncharacterized protein n=1 Tax=Volvox carteri f. nagariensis TaxID=3068 RepID=D8TKR1_VOLCA|nr:uncharacterized protein VOLCADRAFT_120347 [Volvox carteri f. nagariensis]EFJ51930.1 hypothetical protein VOLCADRAFT_120347 [Volvox carteri f. nagariensis]|eukprot:XP_002946704.1 hypothetical protein VOLCADRAFT_120347 [Volvox carteri f. nagariensis]